MPDKFGQLDIFDAMIADQTSKIAELNKQIKDAKDELDSLDLDDPDDRNERYPLNDEIEKFERQRDELETKIILIKKEYRR